MNQLTSFQRKLVYLAGIVVLFFFIVYLGSPASRSVKSGVENETSQTDDVGGGKLASLRRKYHLGESTLGDVDPSSATMNLVLVGLRGIAVNHLWLEAMENQKTKNWHQLKANIESIILLQPYFIKVWEYQGWNLAYNVSAEWDLVEDKYYWIKEGAKFSIRGTERNAKVPELYWWTGIILGDKISNHDAWEYMRKFFNPDAYDKSDEMVGDPEIRAKTGKAKPDAFLNPTGVDNYLVAKAWFHRANDANLKRPQRRMDRILFRQRPARAQMSYAEMMMKEGRFDEDSPIIIEAWNIGYREWTKSYSEGKPGFGMELFDSPAGKIRLDAQTDQEMEALRQLDDPPGKFSLKLKQHWVDRARKTCNYNYWKLRAMIEALPETIQAHREIYQGRLNHKSAKHGKAIQHLESGLNLYAKLMKKHPELLSRDESIEEVMIAILTWQDANRLLREDFPRNKLPNSFFRPLWESRKKAGALPLYERFMRRGLRIR